MADFGRQAKDASKSDAPIKLEDYGSGEPKVEPGDLEGDAAILTVERAERASFTQDGKEKFAIKLYFTELPDKVLFLANKTDVGACLDNLGDRLSAWVGKSVPVEVAVRKFGKQDYSKVVPLPSDDWDEALRPPKKAAPKRGKR